MMLGGKIGARSSGPAGCRVAGLSGGAGGVGRSATMLYQALGILSSSRTNFFLYSLMIYLLSKHDSGADARLVTPWMGGREDHGAVVGGAGRARAVSYTHLRAHETRHDLVCRLLLEKTKH